MNTSTLSSDKKIDDLNYLSKAISLLDKYDASNFIDAMQAARFKSTLKNRYGRFISSDEAFWNEVSDSLQSNSENSKD